MKIEDYYSDKNDTAALTPARLSVLRSGTRPDTFAWLDFRADHALARDAVTTPLDETFKRKFIETYGALLIDSTALTREEYIVNPPSGKRVDANILPARPDIPCDVQIVIADGLSPRAVEINVPRIYPMLVNGFAEKSISFSPPVIVLNGRVAVADQIAHHNRARIALNLIGERPGLSSAESLSCYLTYNPGPETISSHRTVVSNIHSRGTPALEAGAFIVKLVEIILSRRLSGVSLQAQS